MVHRLNYCGGLGKTILDGGSCATAAMADAIPTPILSQLAPEGPCHKETTPAQVN